MTPYIAVVGPDPCDEIVGERSERIGSLLAEAGAVLVCGGLGGTMERAAKGAFEAGGLTLGILPGTSRVAANRYLTLSVPTGMGEMRNALNVRASDAVIAVAGEFGTLSEIAFALKTGVPVVGLDTWVLAKEGRTDPDRIVRVATPEEAVETALQLARSRIERYS